MFVRKSSNSILMMHKTSISKKRKNQNRINDPYEKFLLSTALLPVLPQLRSEQGEKGAIYLDLVITDPTQKETILKTRTYRFDLSQKKSEVRTDALNEKVSVETKPIGSEMIEIQVDLEELAATRAMPVTLAFSLSFVPSSLTPFRCSDHFSCKGRSEAGHRDVDDSANEKGLCSCQNHRHPSKKETQGSVFHFQQHIDFLESQIMKLRHSEIHMKKIVMSHDSQFIEALDNYTTAILFEYLEGLLSPQRRRPSPDNRSSTREESSTPVTSTSKTDLLQLFTNDQPPTIFNQILSDLVGTAKRKVTDLTKSSTEDFIYDPVEIFRDSKKPFSFPAHFKEKYSITTQTENQIRERYLSHKKENRSKEIFMDQLKKHVKYLPLNKKDLSKLYKTWTRFELPEVFKSKLRERRYNFPKRNRSREDLVSLEDEEERKSDEGSPRETKKPRLDGVKDVSQLVLCAEGERDEDDPDSDRNHDSDSDGWKKNDRKKIIDDGKLNETEKSAVEGMTSISFSSPPQSPSPSTSLCSSPKSSSSFKSLPSPLYHSPVQSPVSHPPSPTGLLSSSFNLKDVKDDMARSHEFSGAINQPLLTSNQSIGFQTPSPFSSFLLTPFNADVSGLSSREGQPNQNGVSAPTLQMLQQLRSRCTGDGEDMVSAMMMKIKEKERERKKEMEEEFDKEKRSRSMDIQRVWERIKEREMETQTGKKVEMDKPKNVWRTDNNNSKPQGNPFAFLDNSNGVPEEEKRRKVFAHFLNLSNTFMSVGQSLREAANVLLQTNGMNMPVDGIQQLLMRMMFEPMIASLSTSPSPSPSTFSTSNPSPPTPSSAFSTAQKNAFAPRFPSNNQKGIFESLGKRMSPNFNESALPSVSDLLKGIECKDLLSLSILASKEMAE